jgi:two-component system CheB/CheR fusion protein
MGTDGTLGLLAVKEKMGVALVQDPKTAKYDGMPRSAVETGLADYVAPVEELPGKLLEYIRQSALAPLVPIARDGRTLKAADQIFSLIRARTGHDFSLYKDSSIFRRLERRLNIHKLGIAEYTRYLQEKPQEVDLLVRELLIGVTGFFRDPEAFKMLKTKYLPALIKEKEKGSTIRVWVAGCSTGEEAYSIAIVLRELLDRPGFRRNYRVQIFATDIGRSAIEKARSGVFSAGIAADVSPERLRKYFTKLEGGYRINKEVREMIIFSIQNVITDPPFTRLDLISCRNLLIYFTSEVQKKVLSLFFQAMNPSGLLFLGSSETVGNFSNLFPMLDAKWKIHRKKGGALPAAMRNIHLQPAAAPPTPQAAEPAPPEREPSIPELVRAALLEEFTPSAVVVDAAGEILYTSGRTGKYLEPPVGKTNWNILAMAREGLSFEIRSAIGNASALMESVVVKGVAVKVNGGQQRIDLTVKPLKSGHSEPLMVVFRDIEAVEKISTEPQTKKSARFSELERELRRAKEHLNSSMEEMRRSQEESRSSSEELQSANEELQSTNEELISSKEEMQSLNEELMTLNSELQTKVDALLQAENDMKNLLNSTEVASVFLDINLQIRRFTPRATKLFKLIPGDVGRPITDISTNLKYERIAEDSRRVLDTLGTKELQLETREGDWYLMRILPYRTVDNVIQGIVITLADVTPLKRLEESLDDARRYAESIVETVREPLVILDGRFRVVSANRAFYTTFHTEREKTEKKLLFSLGNRQWDIPALRELLEKIIPQKKRFDNFRVEHTFPKIGRKTMLLNACLLQMVQGRERMILLAIQDVSSK